MIKENRTTAQTNEVALAIRGAQLEALSVTQLAGIFEPLYEKARDAVRGACDLVVVNETQLALMAQAREIRLEVRRYRIDTEKARVTLKADSLKRGQVIDKVARIITAILEPAELHLENQEKFAERAEEKRRELLNTKRLKELSAYTADTGGFDFGGMSEELYQAIKESVRLREEERAEIAKRAAAEEKRRAREATQLREENTRLRLEKEANDRAMQAEKEKQEQEKKRAVTKEKQREREAAQLREENARLRLEKDAQDAKDRAERDAKEKREREGKRAAIKFSDPQKLRVLSHELAVVLLPAMTTETGRAAIQLISAEIKKLINRVQATIRTLEIEEEKRK